MHLLHVLLLLFYFFQPLFPLDAIFGLGLWLPQLGHVLTGKEIIYDTDDVQWRI